MNGRKLASRLRNSLNWVGERRDLNPRPLEPQSRALPTELRPPQKRPNTFLENQYRRRRKRPSDIGHRGMIV